MKGGSDHLIPRSSLEDNSLKSTLIVPTLSQSPLCNGRKKQENAINKAHKALNTTEP